MAGFQEVCMPDRILVVEDEASVADILRLYLTRAGFEVSVVLDGKKALERLQEQLPSLLILDLMLPGMDGWEITRWLRERSELPIILLTARKEEVDRIAGLELGADDYVVKPFSPQEVVSRVRAVLRRSRPKEGEEGGSRADSALVFGDLIIDPQTRLVTVNREERSLTAREFDLLYLLARHPRQVYTRDQLLERVWEETEYIDPGTVTVHVRRLREKIESDPANPRHVQTVWGVGYRFEP
jgi:DNA-binding response OmpR family regulator